MCHFWLSNHILAAQTFWSCCLSFSTSSLLMRAFLWVCGKEALWLSLLTCNCLLPILSCSLFFCNLWSLAIAIWFCHPYHCYFYHSLKCLKCHTLVFPSTWYFTPFGLWPCARGYLCFISRGSIIHLPNSILLPALSNQSWYQLSQVAFLGSRHWDRA